MRLIEGLDALADPGLPRTPDALAAHSVVVVGVFDGVHLGHQRLLHELLEMASQHQGVPTVVTFRAHPDAILRGAAPPLLVSVPHRLRLFPGLVDKIMTVNLRSFDRNKEGARFHLT